VALTDRQGFSADCQESVRNLWTLLVTVRWQLQSQMNQELYMLLFNKPETQVFVFE